MIINNRNDLKVLGKENNGKEGFKMYILIKI